MNYIDMHAHMVSRTTDDYEQMAMAGCVALTEPAFWAGYDRTGPEAFADYFEQLTSFEPERAADHGIRHYSWLCLNPKEGENRELAGDVLEIIPDYLDRPNVIGVGEIGLNRVTRNELETFEQHLELAVEHDQLVLIHTPHLEDKYKGTRIIVYTLRDHPDIDPERVLIDHAEEHTIEMILGEGFWAGITLYPQSKTTPARAIDMLEVHGTDRVVVNSACDWGDSEPLAVPQFMREMRRRGHTERDVERVVFDNPVEFLGQSPTFEVPTHRI
ncbi:MAG: TatD family hydrolase [Bradymonadaceae bacterium]